MKKEYESPSLTELGTVAELTLGTPLNKIGLTADFLTALLPDLVGTIGPVVVSSVGR